MRAAQIGKACVARGQRVEYTLSQMLVSLAPFSHVPTPDHIPAPRDLIVVFNYSTLRVFSRTHPLVAFSLSTYTPAGTVGLTYPCFWYSASLRLAGAIWLLHKPNN